MSVVACTRYNTVTATAVFSMPIRVQIGDNEREITAVDSGWVIEQMTRRQDAGESICVRVLVQTNGMNIALSSVDCPRVNLERRQTRQEENNIFDLWDSMNLNTESCTADKLLRFLYQISN